MAFGRDIAERRRVILKWVDGGTGGDSIDGGCCRTDVEYASRERTSKGRQACRCTAVIMLASCLVLRLLPNNPPKMVTVCVRLDHV
jgi:hypothetical protein